MIDGWKDAGRLKLRPFYSDDPPLALAIHSIERFRAPPALLLRLDDETEIRLEACRIVGKVMAVHATVRNGLTDKGFQH